MTKEMIDPNTIERAADAIEQTYEIMGFDRDPGEGTPEWHRGVSRAIAKAVLAALPPEQEVSQVEVVEVLEAAWKEGTALGGADRHFLAPTTINALRAAGYRIVKGGA